MEQDLYEQFEDTKEGNQNKEGNQKPQIKEGQTILLQKEKGQMTKNVLQNTRRKTKDATRTLL